jgi:serine protease inhibitor
MFQLIGDFCSAVGTTYNAINTVAKAFSPDTNTNNSPSYAQIAGAELPPPPYASPYCNYTLPLPQTSVARNNGRTVLPSALLPPTSYPPTTIVYGNNTNNEIEIKPKKSDPFVTAINDFANSFMFSIFLEEVPHIVFSPQSLFFVFASMYVGLNEKQKIAVNELKDSLASKIMINYFVDMLHGMQAKEHNNFIIQNAMKLLESSHVINNFYLDMNYKIRKNYTEIVSLMGTNVKQVEFLTDDAITQIINSHLQDTGVFGKELSRCTFARSFWFSTVDLNLHWIKPFTEFIRDPKNIDLGKSTREPFTRFDGKLTMESYLVCDDDDGNYYEDKLMRLYEKPCYGTNLAVGFMLPSEPHVKCLKLSNATNVFEKLRPVKAYICVPSFSLENTLNIATFKDNEIDMLNKLQCYDDIDDTQSLFIDDIMHFNAITLNKNGMFTTVPRPEDILNIKPSVNDKKLLEWKALKIDRTFTWYIRDTVNGNIILCGLYDGSKA